MTRLFQAALLCALAHGAQAQQGMTPSQVDLKAGYCLPVLDALQDRDKAVKLRGYLTGRVDKVDFAAVTIAAEQAKRDVLKAVDAKEQDPIFVRNLRSCTTLDFLPY